MKFGFGITIASNDNFRDFISGSIDSSVAQNIDINDFIDNKIFIDKRDKRSFQLTTAGNKLREGMWVTPQQYLGADRVQIDFNIKQEQAKL